MTQGLHVCKECLLWGPMYINRAYFGLFSPQGECSRSGIRVIWLQTLSPEGSKPLEAWGVLAEVSIIV